MEYEKILSDALTDPENTDFTKLRLSYTSSAGYNPYDYEYEDYSTILDDIENGKYEELCKTLDTILGKNYLNILAHLISAMVYSKIGEHKKSAQHENFAIGLLESILKSGDGHSYDTAFVVISTSEEYAITMIFKLSVISQKLQKHNGRNYDVLTVREGNSEEELDIYFNVDLPLTWLDKRFKSSENKIN